MNDVVYRQAAIDSVQGIGRLATLPDNDAVIRMSAVEYVLYNLPSAPERKTGKWIAAKYPFSQCSICECYFDTANNIGNFCPNCGSDMGDEQDE